MHALSCASLYVPSLLAMQSSWNSEGQKFRIVLPNILANVSSTSDQVWDRPDLVSMLKQVSKQIWNMAVSLSTFCISGILISSVRSEHEVLFISARFSYRLLSNVLLSISSILDWLGRRNAGGIAACGAASFAVQCCASGRRGCGRRPGGAPAACAVRMARRPLKKDPGGWENIRM